MTSRFRIVSKTKRHLINELRGCFFYVATFVLCIFKHINITCGRQFIVHKWLQFDGVIPEMQIYITTGKNDTRASIKRGFRSLPTLNGCCPSTSRNVNSQGRTNYFQPAVLRLQVNVLRAAFSMSGNECKRCAFLLALMCRTLTFFCRDTIEFFLVIKNIKISIHS